MTPTQRQRAAAKQRERGKLVRRTEPQACERCHREAAVDHHELVRRSQSSTSATDLDLMVPIGRACHDWIGRNPAAAVAEGWARWAMRGSADVSASYTLPTMPTNAPRVALTTRVSPEAKQWVDDNAEAYSVHASVVTRAMLSVATRHPNEVIKAIKAAKEAG